MANPNQAPVPKPGYGEGGQQALIDAGRGARSPMGAPPVRDTQWQAPVIPLNAPSARPDQHVMDGVDIGPGRNAAQAGVPVQDDGSPESIIAVLRGIYAATGVQALLSVVQQLEGTDDFDGESTWGLGSIRNAFGAWEMPEERAMRVAPNDNGITVTGTRAPTMQFDPTAPLDTSMIEDRRVETGMAAAARATTGMAAGAAPPPAGGDMPMPPAESVDRADLIRNRRGPQ